MRLRLYSLSLRTRNRKKIVTRKQKMDSRRRGKRKSPSQEIIFEVSDNDISSGNSDDCNEPEAKISKIEGNSFMSKFSEISNLEINTETLNVEISVTQEQENSIEISGHISVSNSSNEDDSASGSDIIIISEDNIDVLNDSEENCPVSLPAPRPDSIENSADNSVDSSEVIDITDENPLYLNEQESVPQSNENSVSAAEENPIPLPSSEDCSGVSLREEISDETEENLEEGELGDGPIEEVIDVVTKSPSIEEIQHESIEEVQQEYIEVQLEDIEEVEQESKSELQQQSKVEVQEKSEDELDTVEPDLSISIGFSNEKMADLYKFKFLKFIQQFVELEVQDSDGLTVRVQRDSTLNPNDWIVVDEAMCLNEVKELSLLEKLASPLPITPEKTTSKKKRKKKNKKEKELFVLDTNPSENGNNAHFTKYSSKFQIDIEKAAAEDEVAKISVQTCFNCDNNHSIKDCPLPRDFAKINAARQRFKAQRQTSRYHLEEDQKYSHLAPGKISDMLREALGLRKNQLPPYIYQMRKLGYPPGWLEEAKFVHSNLTMFDADGNNVRGSIKKNLGLNPERIVDYPGFNVSMDKNTKDEHRQYRVPPFSDNFSKQAMIEFFEKHYAKEQDDFETCDMDVDTTFEDKEKTTIIEVTEDTAVLANPLINDLKVVDSSLPSPSLTDLEKQKENLLAALDENSSSNPKSVEPACDEPGTSIAQEKLKDLESNTDKVPLDKTLEINVDKSQDSVTSFASPPLNSNVNCVKDSSFGTPILKSSSPYSRLPNPDNFMKDVSPVINFENLPNSTGKYEQMTGVLQKVRTTLKGLQNCKS